MIEEEVPVGPAEKQFVGWRGDAREAEADRILSLDVSDPPLTGPMLLCVLALSAAVASVLFVITGMPLPW